MGKYFGTDGFRGEANCELTADHAFKIGRFLGWYYGEMKRQNGIEEVTYEETEAYQTMSLFMADRERLLERLLQP